MVLRGSPRPGRLLVHSSIVMAILVAGAAVVVQGSFRHSSRVEAPSSLLRNHASWGARLRLAGVVSGGSLRPRGEGLSFELKDEHGKGRVLVRYRGDVPNELSGGRVVEVTGTFDGRAFKAQPSTLVVICGRTEPQQHC